MPAPSALTNLLAIAHPLGNEVELSWTLPTTLPDGWNLIVFRKEGSDITQTEINNYFAGSINDDLIISLISGTDYPDITGISDYAVDNLTTYYYRSVLQDTSDDAVSAATTAGVSVTPTKTVGTQIIDAKALILENVERVMKSYGMEREKHYQLAREYGMPEMRAPILYVTRVGGHVLNQFIGYFREIKADMKNAYGEIEMDNIQVVWEDPNAIRRDTITNIFRENKEFFRQYLMHPNGGGMTNVEIMIEGDVINEAVRDRVQIGGMMLISCVIESEITMNSTLASWLDGEGLGTE